MRHSKLVLIGAALSLTLHAWAQDNMSAVADDSAVNAKVKAALIGDPITKARQIDVEVSQGIVQLNGFVDSASAKARAEELARGVEGVNEVRNNLELAMADRAVGTVVDDGTTTTKVKAALVADDTTKAHQINVSTREGVVQLSGFVDSGAAKAQAERLARGVSGVRDVKNDLDVRAEVTN
jgi:hyperosmotically inducible protein